jgi:hypothetical protein
MEGSNSIQYCADFYNQDLNLIYRQISIENEMLFDVSEEKQFLIDLIENNFDKEFLMIDSKLLISDVNNLNNSFVVLIKLCVNNKRPYKKVENIFIEFCDYFDLPYNKTYVLLHEKIQILIKNGFIKTIGKSKFNKLNQKYNPESSNILSLFDLVKKP